MSILKKSQMRPVLLKFVTHTFIILLTLFIIFTANNLILLTRLNNSFREQALTMSNNAIYYLEDRTQHYTAIAVNVANYRAVQDLSWHRGSVTDSFVISTGVLQNSLRSLRITNNEIEEVLILLDNLDTAFVADGTMNADTLQYWTAQRGIDLSIVDSNTASAFFTTGEFLIHYNNYQPRTHVFLLIRQPFLENMLTQLVPLKYGAFVAVNDNETLLLSNGADLSSFSNEPTIYYGNWLNYRFYGNSYNYLSIFSTTSAISIVTATMLIVLVLFFVFDIKKILYDPVGNILNILDSDWRNSNVRQNEFFIIFNAINNMHNKLAESLDATNAMRDHFRHLAFNQLVTEEATEEIKAQIDLQPRQFCTLVILFEDDDGKKDSLRVKKFAKEITSFSHYQVFSISKYSVYYFFVDSDNEYRALINYVNNYLKHEYGFCQCGISALHIDIDNIGIALEEGLRAFHEISVSGLVIQKESAIFNGLTTDDGCKISMSQYNQLISAAMSGDIKKVATAIQGVLTENNNANALDKRHLLLYLHSTICMLFGAAEPTRSDTSLENIYNLELLFSRINADLARHIQITNDNNRMLDWIENNLHRDISLSDLAETMHLSYSYASRFFTHEIGMNFSEYLQKTRIEFSMRQLAETNKTIDEVAKAAGFISTNTFFRAFKKFAGVTPNTYRNTAQSHNINK